MKFLVLLLLVRYASANLLETLEREARDTVYTFVNEIQTAAPLHLALGIEDSEEVQRLERSIKDELEKHIKDAFDKTLKKIEDAVNSGHEVNPEALKMLRDLKEKMEDLNIGEEELEKGIEDLKKKVDDHLRQILEKMGLFDKELAEPQMPDLFEGILGDLSIREMFIKLKNMILEKLDVPSIKAALAKMIGQATKKLCEWITNKGKDKVMNFFDRILESDDAPAKRAAEDRFQEIKDYLENLEEDVENKLSKFKKWLHDLVEKGLEKAKEKLQKVTEIAKKIISESKDASRKRLTEILEYLRQHEDQFGSLHDLRNIIQEILSKKN